MNHHNPPSPLFQTDGTQPPEPFEQFRDALTDPPPSTATRSVTRSPRR